MDLMEIGWVGGELNLTGSGQGLVASCAVMNLWVLALWSYLISLHLNRQL
jgi:hypothetical protein